MLLNLRKAKRTGKAHIRVSERCCLLNPYQLTGDSKWDDGGELYNLFDLGLDEGGRVEGDVVVLPEMDAKNCIEENSVSLEADGGVKVLSEKKGSDDNFQNNRWDTPPPVFLVFVMCC